MLIFSCGSLIPLSSTSETKLYLGTAADANRSHFFAPSDTVATPLHTSVLCVWLGCIAQGIGTTHVLEIDCTLM